ncbi:hypothetical protein Tco_1244674 [Tanacetum coccineum]
MPPILIPLRPNLGGLHIGIKSQDSEATLLLQYTSVSDDDIYKGHQESRSNAPPSPIYIPFVPEPVYPEFLPVDDEVFPAEEQPLPAADSPTHHHMLLNIQPDRTHTLSMAAPRLAMFHRTQAPTPFLRQGSAERVLALPLHPHHLSLHIHHHSSDTLSTINLYHHLKSLHKLPEMCVLATLRKRLCRTTPGPGYEVRESSAAGTARQVGPTTARDNLRMNHIFSLDDARYDRALLRARVNMLESDRPFHGHTAVLMEEEARLSRAAWAQSMDACDQTHSEGILLRTTVMAQQSEIVELRAQGQEETDGDFRAAESRLSETETVSGGTKDSEEPQDSDDRASDTAGTC